MNDVKTVTATLEQFASDRDWNTNFDGEFVKQRYSRFCTATPFQELQPSPGHSDITHKTEY